MAGVKATVPFRVLVEGHLVRDGVWSIDARLVFEPGVSPEERRVLRGEGWLALIRAIVGEAVRGRQHGAASALVHMTYDDETREFEIADIAPDPVN